MFRTKLHHVGIIVPDATDLPQLMEILGVEPGRKQFVPEYEAECVFTSGAGPAIEFIVPTGPRLAKFNKGIGGLHHIALEVDNLREASAVLRAKGIELLEHEPVEAGPLRINFIPPVYTRGLIVELVERTDEVGESP